MGRQARTGGQRRGASLSPGRLRRLRHAGLRRCKFPATSAWYVRKIQFPRGRRREKVRSTRHARTTLRRRLLFANRETPWPNVPTRSCLAASLLCALAAQTHAVEASPDVPSQPPRAAAAQAPVPTNLDRVQVTMTGTRIPRAGFDTLEPAQVITREDLDAQNITNLADAMARTPGFGLSASATADSRHSAPASALLRVSAWAPTACLRWSTAAVS